MTAKDELFEHANECVGFLVDGVAKLTYGAPHVAMELPKDVRDSIDTDEELVGVCTTLVRNGTLIDEELGHTIALTVAAKIKQFAKGDAAVEAELRSWFVAETRAATEPQHSVDRSASGG